MSGGEDGNVIAWDPRQETPAWQVTAAYGGVAGLAVSDDGRGIVAACEDGAPRRRTQPPLVRTLAGAATHRWAILRPVRLFPQTS